MTVVNSSLMHYNARVHQMPAAAVVLAGGTSLHLRDPVAEGAGPGITITGGGIEAEVGVVT